MYKIIGADQKEYGPVPADQVRKWIAERRANGYTTLEDDWNLLDFLEDYRPRWVRRILSPEDQSVVHPTGRMKPVR